MIISPEEVEEGEAVTLSVDVTNVGEEMGGYTVELVLDGVVVESEEITPLGGGMTVTILFELTRGMGSYIVEVEGLTGSFVVSQPLIPLRPAEFVVSGLVVNPFEVEAGETVMVSATITNVGEESGSHTVDLKLDGEFVGSESVTLDGGDSVTVSFITSSEAEGRHSVEIDGLSGSFTVTEPPQPPLSPGYVAGIMIVIVATAAVIYMYVKGKIPPIFSKQIAD